MHTHLSIPLILYNFGWACPLEFKCACANAAQMLIPERHNGVTTYLEVDIKLLCRGLGWTTVWSPLKVGCQAILDQLDASSMRKTPC